MLQSGKRVAFLEDIMEDDKAFHHLLLKGCRQNYRNLEKTITLAWKDVEGQRVVLDGKAISRREQKSIFDSPLFGLCSMVCSSPHVAEKCPIFICFLMPSFCQRGQEEKTEGENKVPIYSYVMPMEESAQDIEGAVVAYVCSSVLWGDAEGKMIKVTRGELINHTTVFVAGFQLLQPSQGSKTIQPFGTSKTIRDKYPLLKSLCNNTNVSILTWSDNSGLGLLVRQHQHKHVSCMNCRIYHYVLYLVHCCRHKLSLRMLTSVG
jgi:hypothetical protein